MTTPNTIEHATRTAVLKARFAERLRNLEQQRDEIAVRLHLGKADARDEWEKLRVRIDELKIRLARGHDEAAETAERFEAAVKAAFEELRIGIGRVREKF